MDKNAKTQKLSFKVILISAIISIFLLASSMYVALRLGAMPWPIIFSVIMSYVLMSVVKKNPSIHQVNIAQAGASIGGLVASAYVFTIPALWFLEKQGHPAIQINYFILAIIGIIGALIGIYFSAKLRKQFIDDENLPYPSGFAGAEVLKQGYSKKYINAICYAALFAGVFSILRDIFIPQGLFFDSLPILGTMLGISIFIFPMPLASGVGYIIGKKSSYAWMAGAIVGWIFIEPFLRKYFLVQNTGKIIQYIGIGIILGFGFYFFLKFLSKYLKQINKYCSNHSKFIRQFILIFALILCFSFFIKSVFLNLIIALICFLSLLVVIPIASKMTGETNIDPLEQFGIYVGVFLIFLFSLFGLEISTTTLIYIVFFVSISAAVAGDIGHDFKSAKIIGTDAKKIIQIDVITAVLTCTLAPLFLEIIRKSYWTEIFTPVMPAPQAQIVAQTLFISGNLTPVIVGIIIGFLLGILKQKNTLCFGIGVFLGLGLGILIFIGGFLRNLIETKYSKYTQVAIIIAAGIIAGEGIVGFLYGFIKLMI